MAERKAVGPTIKRLRRAQKITQSELAARCGISAFTVSGIERGANTTLLILDRIADALQVSLVDLFRTEALTETSRDIRFQLAQFDGNMTLAAVRFRLAAHEAVTAAAEAFEKEQRRFVTEVDKLAGSLPEPK
jgi:transcriptional regulator with XRE-family HTH domain